MSSWHPEPDVFQMLHLRPWPRSPAPKSDWDSNDIIKVAAIGKFVMTLLSLLILPCFQNMDIARYMVMHDHYFLHTTSELIMICHICCTSFLRVNNYWFVLAFWIHSKFLFHVLCSFIVPLWKVPSKHIGQFQCNNKLLIIGWASHFCNLTLPSHRINLDKLHSAMEMRDCDHNIHYKLSFKNSAKLSHVNSRGHGFTSCNGQVCLALQEKEVEWFYCLS